MIIVKVIFGFSIEILEAFTDSCQISASLAIREPHTVPTNTAIDCEAEMVEIS
jgi:hypothetical protein